MGLLEVFFTGVGLSMDAFAVSVCKGLGMTRVNKKQALILGLFFGGFQALMPALGFLLGSLFYSYIHTFGHWISFGLLSFVGIKALIDVYREWGDEITEKDTRLSILEVFILAIATSIDAFAVGVTFSLMEVNVLMAVIIIGITTFVLSILAVYLGNLVGTKFRTPARIAGGIILLVIGVKILVEGLLG